MNEAKTSRALNHRSNASRVLVKIGGCRITGDDLACLKPGSWLNDEVVDSYMELIARRSRKIKICAVSSFFYVKLVENDPRTGKPDYDYARVARWTRIFDVFQNDFFFVPINQDSHWTLGVVNVQEKCVEHYDSLGGHGSQLVLDNLLQWVEDESKNKKSVPLDMRQWTKVDMSGHLPQQDNSDDCGVFVCKFADYLSRGKKIVFKARHMNYYRRKIEKELLNFQEAV